MSDELAESIAENAAGPQSATGDGLTTTMHPLPDQILADRYLRSNAARGRAGCGAIFQKIVPHGAVHNAGDA